MGPLNKRQSYDPPRLTCSGNISSSPEFWKTSPLILSLVGGWWKGWTPLELMEACKVLDKFWNALNKVQAPADFMFAVSQELLCYADTLQQDSNTVEAHTEITGGSPEG